MLNTVYPVSPNYIFGMRTLHNDEMSNPQNQPANEAELISRARRGDDAAYERLMRDHEQAVFRLAYLLLGDRGDAEDVAQETFIHAFKALNRFDTTRSLRPWLMRITTNLAYNKRRAVGRYIAALRRMVHADPDYMKPAYQDHSHQDSELLWHAVQRLDRADQEIIYLRYFLELSSTETAETLNIAEGTVKSRLHRALGRLRLVIQHDLPDLQEGGHG
jgi:RNA polymerase sigma-70 factor, ECF subfamily